MNKRFLPGLRRPSVPLSSVRELLENGRYQEAEAVLRPALKTDASSPSNWRNLAVVVGVLGRWPEAVKLFQGALRRAPSDATILSDLGEALLEIGRIAKAIKVLEQALAIAPADAGIRVRLARALATAGDWNGALLQTEGCQSYLPALRLRGRLLGDAGRYHDALAVWGQVILLDPDSRTNLSAYASLHWHCGNTKASLDIARRLMDSGPVPVGFRSMYVSGRLHSPEETILDARAAVEEWGRTATPEGGPAGVSRVARRRSSPRRLRVGYVTQEYHSGPAIHFILPLLKDRNRSRFEVFGYHCGPRRDAWTRRATRECDQWRETFTALELEKAVRRDRLDILVDLSGHYGSRLELFQRRNAPIQLSFPNYPGSTGARCMDYILTDRWVCPEGKERQYTEKPILLPAGYLPYRPPLSPRLSPPPSVANGCVTFGLFQRPSKFNAAFWNALASTMTQTPRSRLLIHHSATDLDNPDSAACQHFRFELSSRGVSPQRVRFKGPTGLADHLTLLAGVDLAFDTFPYNGQTTTCECLWMGVPVVSLRGELHVARVGWQTLDRIGFPELVADTVDDYVARAVRLARDRQALVRWRGALRPAIRHSPLMDGSVTRGIEAAYEGVFRNA